MEDALNLSDLLAIWRRRKKHILITASTVFVLVMLVVLILPSIYRSSATILIETQNIPQDLVKSTVTGVVEERLQAVSQVAMSRQNLQDLISKLNLYPDLMDTYTSEEIVEKMRDDIKMEPIKADVASPYGGRPSTATVAFSLSYEGKNPEKVTQALNTLVSLFLEQNLKVREEKADSAVVFLQQQLDELRAEVEQLESRTAAFKEKNLQSLPELTALNLQTMERLQKDITDKRQAIQALQDRRIYLEGQLATVEPIRHTITSEGARTLSVNEEIKNLRNRYIALKSAKSDKHPDMVALRNQIDALEKENSATTTYQEQAKLLQNKKSQLDLLEKKYSASHPDVIRAKSEMEALEKDVESLAQKNNISSRAAETPENPAYINLKTQIASTDLELRSGKAVLADFEAKYHDYQNRVENSPRVEQEYKTLQRDYTIAQAKYQETLSRLQAAKEAKGLEEGRMAEKFTVIEPPQVPEKPAKPKRLLLILVGIILAAGAGMGMGALSEYLDTSVHDQETLAHVTEKPILAAIPYLLTSQDIAFRRKQRTIWVTGALTAVVVILLSIHLLYQPLDVVWLKIVRKFQIYL